MNRVGYIHVLQVYGTLKMAADAENIDMHIDMSAMPVLDVRSFTQDEIRSIARLFGDYQDEESNFVMTSAINKSIFNESSGSRKQTYERHKVSLKSEESQKKLPDGSTVFGYCKAADKQLSFIGRNEKCLTYREEKRRAKENQELIDLICHQMQKHAHPLAETVERELDTESSPGTKMQVIRGNLSACLDVAREEFLAEDRSVNVQMKQRDTVDCKDSEQVATLELITSNLSLEDPNPNCFSHFEAKRTSTTIQKEGFSCSNRSENVVDADQLSLMSETDLAHTESGSLRAEKVVVAKMLEKDQDDVMVDLGGFQAGLEVLVGAGEESEETQGAFVKHVREAVSMREVTLGVTEKAVASETTTWNGSLPFPKGILRFVLDEDPVKAHKPLCLTCQVTFANQYSLRRHLKRFRHKGQKFAKDRPFEKLCCAPGKVTSSIMYHNSERFRPSISSSAEELAEGIHSEGRNAFQSFNASGTSLYTSEIAKLIKLTHLVKKAESFKEGENAGVCVRNETDCPEELLLKQSLKEWEACKENRGLDSHENRVPDNMVIPGRVVNSITLTNADTTNIKCNMYDYRNPSRKYLSDSASDAHAIRRLECRHCDKISYSQREHLNHVRVHSKIRKNFYGLSGVERLKIHESASSACTFVCDRCGKSFTEHKKYLGHRLIHLKRRKKKCRAMLEDSCRPHSLVADGKLQIENSVNMFKYACKHCGKVFDQRRKCNSHLSVHSKIKPAICSNPYEAMATRNGSTETFSNLIEHFNVHLSARDVIFNKMRVNPSGVFYRLHSDSTISRWQDGSSSGADLGACKPNKIVEVTDGAETSFPFPPDLTGIVPDRVLEQTSGALVENEYLQKQSVSIHHMRTIGWSAEGCFCCKQVAGENTRLVVCTWCEREFHSSCLINGLPHISDDWICPHCGTTSTKQA